MSGSKQPSAAGKNPELSPLYPLKLALVLFIIAGVVTALLACINEFTDDIILENEFEETNDALKAVLPAWDHYDDTLYTQTAGSPVKKVYIVLDENNKLLGYCVEVSPAGFGGPVNMIVGFDAGDGTSGAAYKITGIEFVSMSETPGLGTKINGDFAKNLIGKTGDLKLLTSRAKGEKEIQAVTAATISSRAVVTGINAALNAVNQVELSENFIYERSGDDVENP